MLTELPWPQIAGAAVAIGSLIPLLIWLSRQVLRPYFVGIASHADLERRVGVVESMAREAATKQDLRDIEMRIAAVERSSVANGEALSGIKESVNQVRHMVDLLYRKALSADGA